MKFIFSAGAIPALQAFSIKERLVILALAQQKLSVPKKMTLNIIKLAILTPMFFAVATIEGWQMLYYLLPMMLLYPLVTHPLKLSFCAPEVDNAVREYQRMTKNES